MENPLDVARLRADTPGCEHVLHLNNAGAGLMPRPVVSAITDHIELEARIGGYEAASREEERIEEARSAVARLIGAEPRNIAFMENATAAFNTALSAIPFGRDDILLTSRIDYTSNQITYLALQERFGIQVLHAPDLPEGGVDPLGAEELIHRRRPRLVAMSHVPTNAGTVQELAPIGRACQDRGIPFLVDACQSVGQLSVDVHDLGCDFLSATARKFLRGPRGCGFLYVSDSALERGLEPLFIDMRGAHWISEDLYQPVTDALRFENWENAYALILGLGAAAAYANALSLPLIEARVKELASMTRSLVSEIDRVTVLDRGTELCGLVTIDVAGIEATRVVRALADANINAGASLWEYAVLDFTQKAVEGAVRLSPHYFNTPEEIQAAADVIEIGRAHV